MNVSAWAAVVSGLLVAAVGGCGRSGSGQKEAATPVGSVAAASPAADDGPATRGRGCHDCWEGANEGRFCYYRANEHSDAERGGCARDSDSGGNDNACMPGNPAGFRPHSSMYCNVHY